MCIAGRVNAEISRGPGTPGCVIVFVVSNNVIAIFGVSEFIRFMAAQSCGCLIHHLGVPRRIAGEAFMFGASGVFIPTTCMPGIIRFQNHLGQFTGGVICRSIFLAVELTQMVLESNYAWHARCWNKYSTGTE